MGLRRWVVRLSTPPRTLKVFALEGEAGEVVGEGVDEVLGDRIEFSHGNPIN